MSHCEAGGGGEGEEGRGDMCSPHGGVHMVSMCSDYARGSSRLARSIEHESKLIRYFIILSKVS